MVRINSWAPGEMEIDNKAYFSDVVVWWDGTVENLALHRRLEIKDIHLFLGKKPEAVVIGSGARGDLRVSETVKDVLRQMKIKLFIDLTDNAVDIFNGLVIDKRIVGVFHLL